MIHYHGTPLTPRHELEKMKGRHFCVSFAHPSDANWCIENAQSIMWDNGAFSVWMASLKGKTAKTFDPVKFSVWLEDKLAHPHWAVIPDVIDGTVQQQRDLLKTWPHQKELSAPVWHMGLPTDWLLELADQHPKICFGSSGAYSKVGSPEWRRKCDEAWDALTSRGYKNWIHMLRGLSIGGKEWPFASADSTNVARNFKNKGRRKCPEEMAKEIDARQTPVLWLRRQEDLFERLAA